MFYIIIALLFVLLVVWIGINAAFIRKQDTSKDEKKQRAPQHEEKTETSPMPSAAVEEQGEPVGASVPAPQRTKESAQEPRPRIDVEVAIEQTSNKQPTGVFGGRDVSYVLHAVNVPLFTEENWQTAFRRLTDDDRVLGWAAFHDDRLGAADRAYDQEFIDALRQHHRATERLRRQAGLSHVTETAVVGDEGKVWFLTVLDDAWFALFIDRDVDGMQLASELLAPVQTDPSDKTLPGKA